MFEKYLKKVKGPFLINMKEGDDPLKWVRNKCTLVTKVVEVENILDECQTLFLFGDVNLLIVPGAEKIKAPLVEELKKIDKPILFLGSGMRSTYSLYKWLESQKAVLDLALETKGQRASRFIDEIIKRAMSFDKKMKPDAAAFLLSLIEEDPDTLSQEVMKLSCFVGDREEITIKDISLLTSQSKEETLWHFCDALLAKNGDRALHIASLLFKENSSLFPLLRGLRTQLQNQLQIASIMAYSPNAAVEIQKIFPYMKGKILEQNMQTAKRFGLNALKKALLTVDEIDFLAKNGIEEEELLLDTLIAKVVYKC